MTERPAEPPTRWGLPATGGIAATFVENLQLMPDTKIVAVGSRTGTAAEAFAGRYGMPRAYGDRRSLAADEVDVVDTARCRRVSLTEAMWTRCNPAMRQMVRLIDRPRC